MQFPIKLIARQEHGLMKWFSPVAALALTVLAGAVLFACLGKNPSGIMFFSIKSSNT